MLRAFKTSEITESLPVLLNLHDTWCLPDAPSPRNAREFYTEINEHSRLFFLSYLYFVSTELNCEPVFKETEKISSSWLDGGLLPSALVLNKEVISSPSNPIAEPDDASGGKGQIIRTQLLFSPFAVTPRRTDMSQSSYDALALNREDLLASFLLSPDFQHNPVLIEEVCVCVCVYMSVCVCVCGGVWVSAGLCVSTCTYRCKRNEIVLLFTLLLF